MNKKIYFIIGYFLGLIVLFFISSFFLQDLNNSFVDILFKVRYNMKSHEKIFSDLLVVHLDDNSITKYNLRDDDRRPFGLIIDTLNKGKSSTIIFDILFRLSGEQDGDDLLLKSIKDGNNVIFPIVPKLNNLIRGDSNSLDLLESFIIFPEIHCSKNFPIIFDAILPYKKFLVSVNGIGGIMFNSDSQGIIRKLPLLYSYQEGYIPSLVLAGICHYLGVPLNSIVISAAGNLVIDNIQHPYFNYNSLIIPLDNEGNMYINFAGPWEDSISSYSMISFFENTALSSLEGLFENTLALVADMTSVKKDFSNGIFNPVVPNSAILSNAINTILTHNFLYPSCVFDSVILVILLALEGMLFLWLTKNYTSFIKKPVFFGFIFFMLITMLIYIICQFIIFKIIPNMIFGFCILGYNILFLNKAESYLKKISGDKIQPSSFSGLPGILKFKVSVTEEEKSIGIILKEKFKLTQKEIDVAELLLTGKQYKEISGLLNISNSTIKFRIHRIYNKCCVGNKIEFCNLVRSKLYS